jgi:hypothetical protein
MCDRCPCDKCQNTKFVDKLNETKHICQNGFTPDYETWAFHGEQYNAVAAEEEVNDRAGTDRMDEVINDDDEMVRVERLHISNFTTCPLHQD